MNLPDLNHFLRPNVSIFVLGVYLIAFLAIDAPLSLPYMLLVPVFIMVCSASIIFNHYCDYESDRKSKQIYRFPVASGKVSKGTALATSMILMVMPVAVAYVFLPAAVFYLVLFSDFMIIAYSARPLRIKERPYLETIWNGLGYGTLPFYIVALTAGKEITLNMHTLGLIPFLVASSGHILLQVRDIDDDKKGRVRTTSTRLGLKKMITLSKIFVLLAGATIAYLALAGFLNYFAWLALATGAIIYMEHKKMKKVEKSYTRLMAAYAVAGIFFFISLV